MRFTVPRYKAYAYFIFCVSASAQQQMQELLRSNTQVSTLFREVNIRDVAINSPRGILYTTSRNRISLFNLSTGEGRMINAGMNGLEDGALTDAMFSAPEGLDIIPGQWQNGHDTLVIADTVCTNNPNALPPHFPSLFLF
jgi:hypothetical protein